MLPEYVVHVMEGRARLRHHVFRDESKRARAQQLLCAQPQVHEVRCGHASLLLLLQPGADLAALCAILEKHLPELQQEHARAVRMPVTTMAPRRLELRALACVCLSCLAGGLLDAKKLHVFSGLAFAALAARHIWMRRAAL